MKRSLIYIICLSLCTLLLWGCGEAAEEVREKVNVRKVINLELEPFSAEESRKMMNFMSAGRACVSGSVLYTMEFDRELNPCLASYKINGGELSGFSILAEDCLPEFLIEYEGKLYYINALNNAAIERINTDGSGREVLKDGKHDFLSLREGMLYYTDSNKHFCRSGPGGEGEEIVLPEACCYPYFAGEKLLYQKARNEHLYIYNFSDGSDMEISDVPSYGPVIIGDRLYCTVSDGIYSTDLRGLEPVKYELRGIQGTAEYGISAEALIISGVSNTDGIYSWSFKADNARESFRKVPGGGYRLCEFQNKDCSVYTDFEPTGRIKNFVFTSAPEREISYLRGEIR